MIARSFVCGHDVVYDERTDTWRYEDTYTPVEIEGNRPCWRCGRMPTLEGYDACLGYLDGVMSACCGHGEQPPMIIRYRRLGDIVTRLLTALLCVWIVLSMAGCNYSEVYPLMKGAS